MRPHFLNKAMLLTSILIFFGTVSSLPTQGVLLPFDPPPRGSSLVVNSVFFDTEWSPNDIDVKFNEENKLGKGGFGTAYKGKTIKHKPEVQVAVKLIKFKDVDEKNPRKLDDNNKAKEAEKIQRKLKRTFEEVRLFRTMKHPNVLQVSELFVDRTSGKAQIITEFCEKGDLDSFILRNNRLGQILVAKNVAQCFFWQFAKGLHHLHSQRIVHGDIKPANMFITKANILKIADFGFVQQLSPSDGRVIAFSRFLGGTVPYEAPEIISNRHLFDKRDFEGIENAKWDPFANDVWAAGITLFELRVGRLPWSSADNGQSDFRQFSRGNIFKKGSSDEPELKILLEMLATDYEKRITMKQIVADPWFKSLEKTCGKETLTAIQLKQQSFQQGLKQKSSPRQSLSNSKSSKV